MWPASSSFSVECVPCCVLHEAGFEALFDKAPFPVCTLLRYARDMGASCRHACTRLHDYEEVASHISCIATHAYERICRMSYWQKCCSNSASRTICLVIAVPIRVQVPEREEALMPASYQVPSGLIGDALPLVCTCLHFMQGPANLYMFMQGPANLYMSALYAGACESTVTPVTRWRQWIDGRRLVFNPAPTKCTHPGQ